MAEVHVQVETPFPELFMPAVWEWISPFRDRVADDFSPSTKEEFLLWHERQSYNPGRMTYGIRRNGELGGMVVIERVHPAHPTGNTHLLVRKSFWGRQTTVPALKMIFENAFEQGVKTLRSEVFADNHAIISLIESMGGVRYGIPHMERGKLVAQPLPNSTIRNGELLGTVGLILTPEGLADAISSTVRPSDHRSRRGDRGEPIGEEGPAADLDEHAESLTGAASPAEAVDPVRREPTERPDGEPRVPGQPKPVRHKT